jgi:large subunit ribosomal protein L9
MSKRNVQVMLTKDVSKVGKVGDLVKVAPGYARNYLMPQGLAVLATPGVIKEVERRKAKERQRLLELRQAAERQRDALVTIGGYIIKKKTGENNVLFGSVTAMEVAELIKARTNQEIDRREIHVPEIKTIGTYDVTIKLHSEVTATIKLQVVPE